MQDDGAPLPVDQATAFDGQRVRGRMGAGRHDRRGEQHEQDAER